MKYLNLNGIWAWRQNVTKVKFGQQYVQFGFPGMSDIIGIMPGGRFIAVEVKSPTGKLTELQERFLMNISNKGGKAIVAYSFEDLLKGLESP